MDKLRSCYSTDMQFDAAGQIIRRVRWYFTQPGAQFFPTRHIFGSSNWVQSGVVLTGIGERWDSDRPYRKGSVEGNLTGTGNFCGPLDWYQNGCPSNAPDLKLGPRNVPTCCINQTGIAVGGKSIVSYHPPRTGGVRIGGISTISTLPAAIGGVRIGGLSTLQLVHRVKGGVSIGGTTTLGVFVPSTGGVLIGSESNSHRMVSRDGGVLIGGESILSNQVDREGGVQVGGESTYNLTYYTEGGVLIGGVSNVPPPLLSCQAWRLGYSNLHSPTLTQVTGTITWIHLGGLSSSAVFKDPATAAQFTFEVLFSLPCNGWVKIDRARIATGASSALASLIGYNPVTKVGRWVLPSTSYIYPNQQFDFFALT